MVDSVYRTRSLGVAAEGLPDQYADGSAAKVWEVYIGSKTTRTEQYRSWIASLLKTKNCLNVLDVACGTGVDSILLLEEGFHVTSTDASDKMLKYALKKRWDRRHEPAFDQWVIEEGNWLTLEEDLAVIGVKPKDGFDAVVCLGNSFAHLPDFQGEQSNQKRALCNFHAMIKPGGVLVIDHRNYDEILRTGRAPAKNIYYNSEHVTDIRCSNLYVNGEPCMVTLDYTLTMTPSATREQDNMSTNHHFRLSYYPHRLEKFTSLLQEIFGSSAKHEVYGDFKPLTNEYTPSYYIHVIHKQ